MKTSDIKIKKISFSLKVNEASVLDSVSCGSDWIIDDKFKFNLTVTAVVSMNNRISDDDFFIADWIVIMSGRFNGDESVGVSFNLESFYISPKNSKKINHYGFKQCFDHGYKRREDVGEVLCGYIDDKCSDIINKYYLIVKEYIKVAELQHELSYKQTNIN